MRENETQQAGSSPTLRSEKIEHVWQKMDELVQRVADVSFDGLQIFDHGKDHIVYKVDVDGVRYVVKKVQPTAREMLVFGHGLKPAETSDIQAGKRQPPTETVDPEYVADCMRQAHAVISSNLGENIVHPTGIVVRDGNIYGHVYRVQRYLTKDYRQDTDRVIQMEMDIFYSKQVEHWVEMLGSSEFFKLPKSVQEYYRYFGLDTGLNTNAFFRDLFAIPKFIIIDY